jgi:hypothetical protein
MQTDETTIVPPAADAATTAADAVQPVKPKRIVRKAKPKKVRGVTTDRSTIGGAQSTTEGKPLKQVLCEPYFNDEHRKRYRRKMRQSRLAGNDRNANRFFRTHKLHDRHLYDRQDIRECFAICRADSVLAKCLARMLAAQSKKNGGAVPEEAEANS